MTASTIIGPPLQELCTSLAALGAIIALILLIAHSARQFLRARLGHPRILASGAGDRLSLTEALSIDPRRRLYLVECEGARILLLTGGPSDLLVTLGHAI